MTDHRPECLPEDICELFALQRDNPLLTHNRLRYWGTNRHTNGAASAGAIFKLGNTLCANRPRFYTWLANRERESLPQSA